MVLRRTFYWIPRLLSALLLVAVVVGIWLALGYIEGEEVCPDTFEIRTFSYWHPPLAPVGFGKSITGSDEFAVALSLTGTFIPGSHRRWDLVRDNHSRSGPQTDLGARYLADQFQRPGFTPAFSWVEWSAGRQTLAARFWPWVSRLAGDQLYIVLPELFLFAEHAAATDPDTFERDLGRLVLSDVRALREDAVALGQTDRVQRLDSILRRYESLIIQ